MYLLEHPETKDNVTEMTQFVMSQGPDYKDPYIRFLAFDCMNAYGPGGASCTKGIFERVFLINKSVLIPLCSDDTSSSTASSRSTCKEVYRELLRCFYSDIDINDIFQKWYNQFSYDAVPEGTNPLTALSVDARKQHFRDFVRADEAISQRIWTNTEFQRKLEQSIQANNIIFETLLLDAGLGRRRHRGRRHTNKKKQKQGNTMKKQRKTIFSAAYSIPASTAN